MARKVSIIRIVCSFGRIADHAAAILNCLKGSWLVVVFSLISDRSTIRELRESRIGSEKSQEENRQNYSICFHSQFLSQRL
jgi:hypothetical protein